MHTLLKLFLFLVNEVLLSSDFAWVALCFIRLWASAFSLSQSLKSRRVGLIQCFLNLKSDHDSFMFDGNFCTAWFSRKVLLKSASYDSDLKTPTRRNIAAELLLMLSLLCILGIVKWLSLTKCALTIACGWSNLRSKILSETLYIKPQQANSAIAIFALLVTNVLRYVNLRSSVSDCEPIALSN